MENLFELINVDLQKGPTVILDDINVVLQKGSAYAIIGPNGSGKTTFLRLLNLLEPPSRGRIFYAGLNTKEAESLAVRREMAFLSQQPVMFNCSVFENVAMGLRFRRTEKSLLRERVQEILSRLSLDAVGRRNARTLSGGEKQRVAVARAVVFSPKVLLLDEPTAYLDKENEAILETLILGLQERENITIVMVTHNMDQAMRLTDRIVVFEHGRVLEIRETGRTV
ncbi:MAG: phosphate ABC transporter ATP-binding protein [Pseudomonadota bacterium]